MLFSKLINKIAFAIFNATRTKTEVVQHGTASKYAKKDAKAKVTNYEIMDWRDIPDDVKNSWQQDIMSSIISLGYKSIPSILRQYRVEMIQLFVLRQYMALGSYCPEKDNLDSKTVEELIAIALENNQLSFEVRMIEQGKAAVTAKQIETLKANGIAEEDIPKNKFAASKLIDKVFKAKGYTGETSTTPSVSQINAINSMSDKLNISTELPTTRKAASAIISELSKKIGENPSLKTFASDSQIDFAKRLLKSLNKHMTAKRLDEYKALTTQEMSKALNDLTTQVNVLHPEATEGQINYIVSMCQIMLIPVSIEDVKKLTKKEASVKIDSLSRDYLYMITRSSSPSLTKEVIKAMSKDGVKELLASIRLERETKEYTSEVAVVEETHPVR